MTGCKSGVEFEGRLGYWCGVDQALNPFDDSPVILADSPLVVSEPRGKFRFSKENSKEMAARSRISRIQRQKEREEAARLAKLNPPQPAKADNEESKVLKRVKEIDQQIDSVIADMAKPSIQPRDKQALAMALDRLYGIWSLLTGHPRPGVRKTDAKRSRPSFAEPQG